jgi:glutaredoxin
MRRIYAKEGCPHSSKVLAFMAEANLLHDYSLEYDTQENREMIKDRYNGKVMFPACEFGDEKLMIESNDIIKALADEHEIDPNTLVAFQFIFGWPESKRHTMYKTYMKVRMIQLFLNSFSRIIVLSSTFLQLIKYGTEKEGSLDQLMIHLAALP